MCICRSARRQLFSFADSQYTMLSVPYETNGSDKFCKSRKSSLWRQSNDMISQSVDRVVIVSLRVLACLIAAIGLYGVVPMASRAERMRFAFAWLWELSDAISEDSCCANAGLTLAGVAVE